MDSFRPQRTPSPNRLSPPEPPDMAAIAASAGVHDLEEEEIFSTEFQFPAPNHRSPDSSSSLETPKSKYNPSPCTWPSRFGPCRFHEQNLGILAALLEEDNNHLLLHRNLSSYSASSVRSIPAMSKPNADYVLSLVVGKIYHQSAAMNVPFMPPRASRESAMLDWDDVDDGEILPPHEIVARAASDQSPMTTFSMLEGFGRTLKGRDLRRVRNAVWRQTGFQD